MARKKAAFGFPPMAAGGGGLTAPTMRRPTRAALGGAVPRGGRTRVAPALGIIGARGGQALAAPKARTAKKATSARRKKVA